MERETIKLSVDELHDIICGETDEFEEVLQKTTGHWRHGSEETMIVKRISDGKFFELNYRDSVKETMDFSDMNDGGDFEEVFPEKTETIIYI